MSTDDFMKMMLGIDSMIACVRDGSVKGCVEALAPYALGGLGRVGAVALKAERVAPLVNLASKEGRVADDLAEFCLRSFVAETRVVMADGSLKPIAEVHIGDKVKATDPETGETTEREVENTFVHNDEGDMTELTVKASDGSTGTVDGTSWHPMWVDSAGDFVELGDLVPGQALRSPDGARPVVSEVRRYVHFEPVYDLTVQGLHTYYVLAGTAPVLVHNAGCGPRYENPGHHDPTGGPNPYNTKKAVLPADAEVQFANSVQVGDVRWTKIGSGKKAVYYRYFLHGDDVWHWSGSTNGVTFRGASVPIPLDDIPIQVKRM